MIDRAEQMREAAAKARVNSPSEAPSRLDYYTFKRGWDAGISAKNSAIRALPLPPAPPLADDVALVRYEFRLMVYGNGDYNLEKYVDDDGDWVKYDDAADLIKRLARDYRDAGIDAAAWREAAKGMEGHRDHWKARAEKAKAEVARLREAGLAVQKHRSASGKFPELDEAMTMLDAALTPKGTDHG